MNMELYTNAVSLLEDARYALIQFIEDVVRNNGEVNLDHLPLSYINDGAVTELVADGLFMNNGRCVIGVNWYDEDGELDGGNEYLTDLSANELYDIANFLHTTKSLA